MFFALSPFAHKYSNAAHRYCTSQARSPFWLLKPASEHGACVSALWSWTVLLPSDIHKKPITSITYVLTSIWDLFTDFPAYKKLISSSKSRSQDFDGFRRFSPTWLRKSGFWYSVLFYSYSVCKSLFVMSVPGECEHSSSKKVPFKWTSKYNMAIFSKTPNNFDHIFANWRDCISKLRRWYLPDNNGTRITDPNVKCQNFSKPALPVGQI
jgi:hypothetical protein